MKPRLTAALLACAVLPGCGGGDDERGSTRTLPAAGGVVVKGDEYSFDPETVIVTGGGELELTLDNVGALAHNLRLFRDGSDVGGTPTFQGGGEQRSVSLRLEPGSYDMICTVGNHEDLGMTGTLEIRR